MSFTTLFIDLDDTIYPSESRVWALIRARIDRYLTERMGFPPEKAAELRRDLFLTYGTTLRGLQEVFHIDAEDYLAYVHDIPLADYLHPDPKVRSVILSFSQRRFIFTNADEKHARRVLEILNLLDCFEGIIDVHTISPYCKPMPEAYRLALKAAGTAANEVVLIDDAPRNLATACQMGFHYTVRVGSTQPDPAYQACIATIADLARVHFPNGLEI